MSELLQDESCAFHCQWCRRNEHRTSLNPSAFQKTNESNRTKPSSRSMYIIHLSIIYLNSVAVAYCLLKLEKNPLKASEVLFLKASCWKGSTLNCLQNQIAVTAAEVILPHSTKRGSAIRARAAGSSKVPQKCFSPHEKDLTKTLPNGLKTTGNWGIKLL